MNLYWLKKTKLIIYNLKETNINKFIIKKRKKCNSIKCEFEFIYLKNNILLNTIKLKNKNSSRKKKRKKK